MKKAPAEHASSKKSPQRGRELFPPRQEQALAALHLPPAFVKDSEAPTSARRCRSDSAKGASHSVHAAETARPLRVLLIEDTANGSAMRDKVSEGFRMRRAPSLEDACTALGRDSFDVVLLDLRARDAASSESIARLQDACAEVPIVLWNADEESARPRTARPGVSGFRARPEIEPNLALSLRSAVERHQGYQQLRAIFAAHPDGVMIVDGDDTVLFANPAAIELLGQSEEELVGSAFSHASNAGPGAELRVEIAGGRTAEVRIAAVEWEGRSCRLLGLRDVTDRLVAHQRIANLVNELLTTNQKLVHQASQDPLTGLLNRRGLQEALVEELARMHRARTTLSVMLVDCDDFKGINDSIGYAMGDAALVIVANTLRATLRPQDRVGRVGGDEFLVLLPATRPTEASLVGQRLLQELSVAALPPTLRERRLTVSIGVDRVPAEAITIEEVITAAAAPLKVAKSRGKRRVSTAGGMQMAEIERDDKHDVAVVLSDPRCLRVASQSIVRISDGNVIANELFVRGPRGDLEQPSVLFALASSSNSLITFDLNCLRASTAARAAAKSALRYHVNIHPATLIGVSMSTIFDIIGRTTRPNELCIELSEQQLVGSPMRLREARSAFRARGIKVALDDVGFGHSSLEALIVLEPDIVKIDRRFVHGVSKDAGRSRDLKRLAGVLQGLGAEVVAEGIESRADINALARMGIEFGQGYLWGKPAVVATTPQAAATEPAM
jgi:diguanylate cyclase (GGDEF)-like protein